MLYRPDRRPPSTRAANRSQRSELGRRLKTVTGRRYRFLLPVVCACLLMAATSLELISCASAQVWDGGGGTTDWHDADNWNPNGVPGVSDTAMLDASLTGPVTVGLSNNVFDVIELTISDAFQVDTGGFALTVNDFALTGQTNITGAGSQLIVSPNGAFDTDLLLVKSNGRLSMRGGSAALDEHTEIRATGTISGYGDVLFGGNSSSGILLDNKGSISVSSILGSPLGGTLTLSVLDIVPAGATLSLSGSTGAGSLTVNDNAAPLQDQAALRLIIDGETADFEGVLDIGKADTAEFIQDLQLIGGRIEFNANGGTAHLAGTGTIGSNGQIVVNSGTGRIENVVGVGTGSTTEVVAGATLLLANTFTAGGSAAIDVGADATIQFDGTANVITGPPVSSFTMGDDAQLIVHGDLTFDGDTTFQFDWDGVNETADTEVSGESTRLSIVADSLLDAHNADLNISDGGLVEVTVANGGWTKHGNLNLSSSSAGTSSRLETLSGGRADFGHHVMATGDGTSVIDGDENRFDSTVTVLTSSDATLRIRNSTIEGGGTWGDGNGTLQNANRMIVDAIDTTMDFATVDLDGPGGEATVTLNAPLALQVGNINDEAGNVFGQDNGSATTTTMVVDQNGRLDVSAVELADAKWTIGENATVELFAAAAGSTHVGGADVQVDGTVQVSAGASRWEARTTIGASGEVTIAAGTNWGLEGGSFANPNRLEGGRITGGGLLRSGDFTGLHGFGTIDANVNYNGFDRELMAADGMLDVNGTVIAVGRIGTANTAGTLRFGQGFNTQLANDALVLNGGVVTGATVNNGGTTRGFGTIQSQQFVQGTTAGTTSATTGQLTIDVVQPAIAVSLGTLNAVDGDLVFVKPLLGAFDGTVNVGDVRQIEFQSGWILSNGGQLNFNGSSGTNEAVVVGETLVNGGAIVNVANNGVFRDRVTFGGLAQVILPNAADILLLEGDGRIPFNGPQTALFVGLGVLSNQAGSLLVIEADVNSIHVDLRNRGTLELEQTAPGTVGVNGHFVQFFSGSTNLDIEGLSPGSEHDRFAVSGTATLDGTFSVKLGGGFSPVAGDSFDLIDFSSASGTPSFTLPSLGVGLAWDTSQFVSLGLLSVTNVSTNCDFDGNATCDVDDMRLLYDDIDAGVIGGVTDLDGNGVVDNDDIDDWLALAGSENGKTYVPGDTDLDGGVLGNDFTTLASGFGNDGLPGAYWDQGNFDGNAGGTFLIGGSDFTLLAANFGSVSVSAVPEPAALGMWLLGSIAALGLAQRPRRV